MPVDAAEIERGLDWLINNEAGTAFQRLAVGLAMQERPDLIPTSTKSDLGADAISPSVLSLVHGGPRVATAASLTATAQKINADSEEISKNYGRIDLLEFYTPRPITQKKIKKIAASIKDKWGHDLIVHPRESLIQRLLVSRSNSLCVSFLRISIPDAGLDEIERRAREATQHQLTKRFASIRNGTPLMELNLCDSNGLSWTHEQLTDLLDHGAAFMLRGDPGGGKTTTLLQLATRMVERNGGRLPLYVDLPSWFLQGGDLIGYLERQPGFLAAALNGAEIARILDSGRCALFLNGWNEIQGSRREVAHAALLEVRRNFPTTALAVASRPADDLPNISTAIYDLMGIGYQQRNEYLRLRFGDTATEIIDALERDIRLSRLTRNPLLLDAVGTSFERNGTLPRTRTDAIRASLSALEQHPDHAPALQHGAVKRHAAEFLAELARVMTDRGAVLIPANIASDRVAAVQESLAEEDGITGSQIPGEVLDCLISHHVLRRPDDGIGYAFSHQVYQEFYAAEKFRRQIESIFEPGAVDHAELGGLVAAVLNRPDWSASIISVVETLQSNVSDGDHLSLAKLQLLIMCSSLIDPIFSATLIRLTDDSTWQAMGNAWQRSLDTWTALPVPYELISLTAKIESGRLDFQNEVWGALEANRNRPDTVAWAPSGISPVSLGPQWRERVQAWPQDRRRDLLRIFGHYGASSESIEAVTWFAEEDPSEDIQVEATESLLWNGAWQRASAIILQMNQAVVIRWLGKGLLQGDRLSAEADDQIRRHALAELEANRSPLDQLILASRIDQDLRVDVIDFVKQALTTEGFSFGAHGSDRWRYYELEKWAIRYVRKGDPEWAREWILNAFTRGHLVGELEDYLPEATTEELAPILEIAISEAATGRIQSRHFFDALAAMGNARIVAAALRQWRDVDERNDLAYSLREFLRNVSPADLVSAIVEEFPAISVGNIGTIRSLLGTSTAFEDRKYEPGPDHDTLLERWRALLPAVIESEDFGGWLAANYANVLSCIGDEVDIERMQQLIEKDIMRWNNEEQLLLEWRARGGGPQPNVSRCSQTTWLLGSLIRLGPEVAKGVLVELLDQRHYEQDAQSALIWLAIRPFQDKDAEGIRTPAPWARAWRTINGRDNRLVDAETEVANVLRPRILQLFESIDPDDAEPSAIGRLKGLCNSFAKVAAQEDCELILSAMALPGRFDSYSRLSAVESLYSRGLPLSHEGLERVFSDIWTKARQSRWLDDNDSHCLACSMQGLAFSDHPDRAMPVWREFSDRIPGHKRGDLLMAIIASGFAGCLEMAYELDCHFDPNNRSWAFVEGILRYSDRERAASLLIDIVLGGDWRALDRGVSYHQRSGLNQVLSVRIENDTQTRLSLVEAGKNDRERRNWIAFLLGSSGEVGLEAALELLDDAADEPVPGGLWNAITEKWLVDQIPHEGGAMISMRPRPANILRSSLLTIALADPVKKRSALTLLGKIYCERLDRGEAVGEDRHPDINQGCCWPLVDWSLDEALRRIVAELPN